MLEAEDNDRKECKNADDAAGEEDDKDFSQNVQENQAEDSSIHSSDFSEDVRETLEKTDNSFMESCNDEEETIKKKYGGILPRKLPLISKDHEHAFFDSADWALGKQGGPAGQKPKGPIEALRPKLQPTPQQHARSRRSAYAPADAEDGENAMTGNKNRTE